MENRISMDNVLKADFGETSSEIRATFKKTINVRQYETEAYEVSTTLQLEKPVTGVERMLISSVLQAQLEYSAYIQLHQKGYISDTEFATRKSCLEEDIYLLKAKAEAVLGRDVNWILKCDE